MTRPKNWVRPRPLPEFREIPLENAEQLRRKLFARIIPGLSEHVCWSMVNAAGYSGIVINGITYGAHRVSYALHHGQPPRTHHIAHKCDNPRCINPHHLEAVEPAENTRQACDRFLMQPPRGEKCGTSKMTREQVLAAIDECKKTGHGYRRISKRLGLPPSAVKDVLSGRSWQHITGGKPVGVTAKPGRWRAEELTHPQSAEVAS